MIASITPAGYGSRTRINWLVAVTLYSVGAAIASSLTFMFAASVGVVLSAVSPSIFDWRWGLISLLAFAYCLQEFGLIRMPQPQRKKQVPRSWREKYHPWVAASAYGFVIGSGIATRISISTFYVLLVWCFLSKSPIQAALTGSLYGLGQGCLLLITAWNVQSPTHATRIATGVWSWMFAVHRINAVFLGLVTIYACWMFTASR